MAGRTRKVQVGAEPAAWTPTSGPREVRVLPVRNTVVYPFGILPLGVSRDHDTRLLNDAIANDRLLAVVMQRDPSVEEPGPADIHDVGTVCNLLRMVRLPDGQLSVLLQGVARVKIGEVIRREPYLFSRVVPLEEIERDDVETRALVNALLSQFQRVVTLSPQLPDEAGATAESQSSAGRTADFIASLLDLRPEDKQSLLETLDVKQRLQSLNEILARELQVLEVGAQIQEQVRESLDERQKEFLLRQQLEAIQKELGEGDDAQREIAELKERIEKAQMPPDVRKEARSEEHTSELQSLRHIVW